LDWDGPTGMRLSVHMMVLNAASVIERALRSVASAANEICIVDTGSSDGTPEIARCLADELGIGFHCVSLHPPIHPELYFQDEPASWRRAIPGPSTGLPILRDWADARNRGLGACHGDWILKLDADDECLDPDGLAKAVHRLAARPGIDYLVCPYEIVGQDSCLEIVTYQDRLWRNKPSVRFHLPLHERLSGRRDGNWLISAAGLRFRDWRDSAGMGVRIAHRNFKVLLAARERLVARGGDLEPPSLYDLGNEALGVDPEFALGMFDLVRDVFASRREDAALWHKDVARARQSAGDLDGALSAYRASIEIHPRMAASWLGLGLLEHEMGQDGWEDDLESAIRIADETGRFNVSLPDLAGARGLLGMPAPKKSTATIELQTHSMANRFC